MLGFGGRELAELPAQRLIRVGKFWGPDSDFEAPKILAALGPKN